MNHELSMLLTIAFAAGFGLLAQVLSRRLRIPAIVVLLLFGIIIGKDFLNIIDPSVLGGGMVIVIKLAVAIILFEGALNLRLNSLRNSIREVRNLVSFGVLFTWVMISVASHYLVGLSWQLAILFGALMTVTGPTVVQPLLKRINISKKIKNILEGEAILIDPIGAILAVAVMEVIIWSSGNQHIGIVSALWGYFGRLTVGLIVGIVAAIVLSRLMKITNLIPADLSNLVVLAGVWLAFGLAEMINSESGIMASVAMGLTFQREAIPGERQLRQFKESLTTLSISILFVLLAANLDIDSIVSEGLIAVLLIIIVMFVIRPISVFLSTWRTDLNWKEKILISWIAPRGIVAAAVASLFWFTLNDLGFADAQRLPALTFLAIMMTITIQGLSASKFARVLKLQSMEGRKVVVVGASKLGRNIAEIINNHERPVILIDTNEAMVKRARKAGIEAIAGNALNESVLEDAGMDETETIVAVTPNSEVNVLVAQLAYEEYGVKCAFPALNDPDKGAGDKILGQTGGRLIFGKPVDVLSWEYAAVRQFTWEVPEECAKKGFELSDISDDLLPVIRIRENSPEVVRSGQAWQPKDKIIFLTRTTIEQTKQYLSELLTKDKKD